MVIRDRYNPAKRAIRTILWLGATWAWLVCASPLGHAQDAGCSEEAETQARRHYEDAERYKSQDQYAAAATGYQRAFETCERPFLLYNAAQMLWQGVNREAALQMYEHYLQREPDGPVAGLARERFFEYAEELREADKLQHALVLYQRYLTLAPDGEYALTARRHLESIRDRIAENPERYGLPAGAHRSASEPASHPDGVNGNRPRVASPALDWRPLALLGSGAGIMLVSALLLNDETRTGEVGFIVGGVVFTTGLAWLVVRRVRPDQGQRSGATRPVSVLPMLGPGMIGGAWSMRF